MLVKSGWLTTEVLLCEYQHSSKGNELDMLWGEYFLSIKYRGVLYGEVQQRDELPSCTKLTKWTWKQGPYVITQQAEYSCCFIYLYSQFS